MTSSLPVAIPDQLKGKGLRFTRLRPPVIGDKTTGKAPCDPSFYDEGALREDDPTLLSYVEAGNGFGMVGTFGNFIGFDADQGERGDGDHGPTPSDTDRQSPPQAGKPASVLHLQGATSDLPFLASFNPRP